MRILGIDTSSSRGSVALIEGGALVASVSREQENAHAEGLPPMIEQVLAQAGWIKGSLERLAVGVGPGSFTGLRMGIGLALGIARGLHIPVVGVCSLKAMALAAPPERPGLRCPLLDARRGEFFVAAYALGGHERLAPCAIPRAGAVSALRERLGEPLLLLGNLELELEGAANGAPLNESFRSYDTDLPHAAWVARAAIDAPSVHGHGGAAIRPLYIRDAVERPPAPGLRGPSML